MREWSLQQGCGVRFEWGPTGARQLAPDVACLVVVDVLSFTTSVTIAVEAGTRVFPYAWRDRTALAFAREHAAELAVGRRETTPDSPWSLSPAALGTAPFTPRLVLPSPNGSAISAAAAAAGGTVIAGSLRNATAVARWLTAHGYGRPERPVGVVAAGEHWPDGSLRPALEDLLGAGAVIAGLHDHGAGPLSPEAAAAHTTFTGTPDPAASVTASSSGRELTEAGFPEDVAIATALNTSPTVPLLTHNAFTPA
ncbi:2-phosphosulfolactate phosphatase [Streptomyces sp. NPDC051211]|uniref:2-phosphosulfolactate phosphatase n=1 Tax=Streptomyces sp. NPDC051211 TaxID=3154643 RepID=UPI00344CDA55